MEATVLSRDGLTAWQYAHRREHLGEHRSRGLTLPENLYHHDSLERQAL